MPVNGTKISVRMLLFRESIGGNFEYPFDFITFARIGQCFAFAQADSLCYMTALLIITCQKLYTCKTETKLCSI